MLPDGRVCLKRDLSFLNGDGNLLELKNNWEKSSSIYEIGEWQQMLNSSLIESDSIYGVLIMIHGRGGEDGLLSSFFELQNIVSQYQ